MTPRSLFRSHFAVVLLVLAVAGAMLALSPRAAWGQRHAFGYQASTLGIGADLTVRLTDRFNARAGGSYFPFRHSGVLQEEIDVKYKVDVRLAAVRLFLDWHPFGNAFRLSAGGLYNGTRVQGHAQPVESYTVQQKTFEPEELGDLDAEVSFANRLNPYLGIGFGNAVKGSRFDLYVDLGVMYVAQPKVQMNGTGLISATTNHESTLNDALRSFHLFPYFSLGFSISI